MCAFVSIDYVFPALTGLRQILTLLLLLSILCWEPTTNSDYSNSASDRRRSAIHAAAIGTCPVPSVPVRRNPSTATTSPPSSWLSNALPAMRRALSVASLARPHHHPLDQPPNKPQSGKKNNNEKSLFFLLHNLLTIPGFFFLFSPPSINVSIKNTIFFSASIFHFSLSQ